MKKFVFFIVVLILTVAFSLSVTSLSPPHVQPIHFASENELHSFINDPTEALAEKNDEAKAYFTQLCNDILSDGYIPYLEFDENIASKGETAIIPRAEYEDASIWYYITYKDQSVKVCIYRIDERFKKYAVESLESYSIERFGLSALDSEKLQNVNNIFINEPYYRGTDGDGNSDSINGIIDENYYLVVKSDLPCNDMLELLRGVTVHNAKVEAGGDVYINAETIIYAVSGVIIFAGLITIAGLLAKTKKGKIYAIVLVIAVLLPICIGYGYYVYKDKITVIDTSEYDGFRATFRTVGKAGFDGNTKAEIVLTKENGNESEEIKTWDYQIDSGNAKIDKKDWEVYWNGGKFNALITRGEQAPLAINYRLYDTGGVEIVINKSVVDISKYYKNVVIARLVDYTMHENGKDIEKINIRIEQTIKGDQKAGKVRELVYEPNFNGTSAALACIESMGPVIDGKYLVMTDYVNKGVEMATYEAVLINEDGSLKTSVDKYADSPYVFSENKGRGRPPHCYDCMMEELVEELYGVIAKEVEYVYGMSLEEAYNTFEDVYLGDIINTEKVVYSVKPNPEDSKLRSGYIVDVRVNRVYKGNFKQGEIVKAFIAESSEWGGGYVIEPGLRFSARKNGRLFVGYYLICNDLKTVQLKGDYIKK